MEPPADCGAEQQRPGHRRQRRRGLPAGRLAGERVGGRRDPGRFRFFARVVAVDLPAGERAAGQQATPGRDHSQARPAASYGGIHGRHRRQRRPGQPDPRGPPARRPQHRPAHRLARPRRQRALGRGARRGNAGAHGCLGSEASHPARWCPVIARDQPGKRRAGRLRRHHQPVLRRGDDPGRQRLIQARPGEQARAEARARHRR
jgi:hypothetical protein